MDHPLSVLLLLRLYRPPSLGQEDLPHPPQQQQEEEEEGDIAMVHLSHRNSSSHQRLHLLLHSVHRHLNNR